MSDSEGLSTVASIATSKGLTVRQVQYAIASRRIEPTGWVGPTRVYGPEAVKAIKKALAESTTRSGPRRPIRQVEIPDRSV